MNGDAEHRAYRIQRLGHLGEFVRPWTNRDLSLGESIMRPKALGGRIGEPENGFVRIRRPPIGCDRVQFIVTTHSPLLLDFLDDPAAVRIVQRGEPGGTVVLNGDNPNGVRKALDESGFGLGEYYETKGFGG